VFQFVLPFALCSVCVAALGTVPPATAGGLLLVAVALLVLGLRMGLPVELFAGSD